MGVTTHPHVSIPEPIITCVVAAYYPDAAHVSPPIIKVAVYRTDTVPKQPGKRATGSGVGKLHPCRQSVRGNQHEPKRVNQANGHLSPHWV